MITVVEPNKHWEYIVVTPAGKAIVAQTGKTNWRAHLESMLEHSDTINLLDLGDRIVVVTSSAQGYFQVLFGLHLTDVLKQAFINVYRSVSRHEF